MKSSPLSQQRKKTAPKNNNKILPACFGRFSAGSLLPSALMAILSILYSWYDAMPCVGLENYKSGLEHTFAIT